MKIKFTFALLFIGLFCFGQSIQDSIAIEKKKQRNERILAEMIKRKEEAEIMLGKRKKDTLTDTIKIDDKAIFDRILKESNDSMNKLF